MSYVSIYANQAEINGINPNPGDIVLRSSDNMLLLWSGSQWKEFEPDAGVPFSNSYSTTFDGSTNTVSVGDVFSLSNSNAFTVSAHFKANTANGYIFGFRGFYARIEPSGGIFGRIDRVYTWSNSGSGQQYYGLGNWHHIVVVWDSPSIICYIDGNEIMNVQPGGPANTGADNGNSLHIGSHYAGSVGKFNGKIDDVAIWSKALSPTEVSTITPSPTNLAETQPANLQHWWRMGDADDINGNTITDQVGNLDATTSQSGPFSTDTPN